MANEEWAIKSAALPESVRVLDVYDRQLGQANRSNPRLLTRRCRDGRNRVPGKRKLSGAQRDGLGHDATLAAPRETDIFQVLAGMNTSPQGMQTKRFSHSAMSLAPARFLRAYTA
jgi:hypothetical protein